MSRAHRDPARIDRMLALVRRIWIAHPDLRLGQIIVNAALRGEPNSAPTVFYREDEGMEQSLEVLASQPQGDR